jgi:hypothetical protein
MNTTTTAHVLIHRRHDAIIIAEADVTHRWPNGQIRHVQRGRQIAMSGSFELRSSDAWGRLASTFCALASDGATWDTVAAFARDAGTAHGLRVRTVDGWLETARSATRRGIE